MNLLHRIKTIGLVGSLSVLSSFGFTAIASATARPVTPATQVKAVIAAGDEKVAQRLADLTKLTAKVNATTKLSSANKAALLAEISSTTTGLNSLKTKLDADTTLETAKTDSKLKLTDYRVYLLVVPKVRLVKVADNQLTKETQLLGFADLLKTKVASSDQSATLTPKVADMIAKVSAAQKLSQEVAATVLPLKPSDYNSNRTILKANLTKLQQAQANNVAAHKLGNEVVVALGGGFD